MKLRIIGIALLLVAIGLAVWVTYANSERRQEPVVFSKSGMLNELWRDYKDEYVEPSSGRTLDKQREEITTSEGEGYTMLRAVWVDDQATFDQSWKFTKDNLQRQDKLFSWLYGKRADGTFGILTDRNGQNSAADGDIDIATALIFAGKRWNQEAYLTDAREIIAAIWQNEVTDANGTKVLVAAQTEKSKDVAIVNPSYFAPGAFRLFAEIDPGHDWKSVADGSYSYLQKISTAQLDKAKSVGLPPDWVQINLKTGDVVPPNSGGYTTNYGYDALRVAWRVRLDWEWYKNPQAKSYLDSLSFLRDEWRNKGKLATVYSHDGSALGDYESPAAYGGAYGAFLADDSAAKMLYDQKLKVLYDPDTQGWRNQLSYYDDNLAWFGIALAEGALSNLGAK